MENGVGAQEVLVTQCWECKIKNHKVKLESDKTKEWSVVCAVTILSYSQGGFHFIYLAVGGSSHLYLAGLKGRNVPLCHTHALPLSTAICVLKAIEINGDHDSYEPLICQLVN